MPNGRADRGSGRRESRGGGPELPRPERVQYFEGSGNQLRAALLDSEADDWAKQLCDLKPSQLRRFYNHVLAIDRKLRLEAQGRGEREWEAAFERLRPELLMLKAKAAYACGRGTIREPLLKFITNHTASVSNSREFEAFRRHFEAVVAFHGFYKRED